VKSILNVGDLSGKRILIRVDWNVPIIDGKVTDDFRIRQSFDTIEYLKKQGAKLILISHLEPEEASLRPVFEAAKLLIPGLSFDDDGDIVLLENLRKNPGEKQNDQGFAESLASLADIYVNDAFSASHREHASIVSVPKMLPSYAGIEFIKEVEGLKRFFTPEHPFLFILGGAKFETKLPLVEKFLNLADTICIMGANAKPASLLPLAKNPKVVLPIGDVAALDADEANLKMLEEKIKGARLILWNGPLGLYEKGYKAGTLGLAKILAESGKEIVIGGADTLSAIKELNIEDKFTFVSAAGGAMLDFLAHETLPGIEALN
jgi:phosphoglycerate kinase